jgi:hypothetical protein
MRCTAHFWDCECESHYIHPASALACPLCGATRDESPDSRVVEVEAEGLIEVKASKVAA